MNFVQKIWSLAFHHRFLLFLLMMEKGLNCIVRRMFLRKNSNMDGRKRVLIIRTDEIGDFFLWLPFGRSLRKIYPADKYELVLLGNHLWLEAAKAFLRYDKFIEFDKRCFNSDRDYFMSMYTGLRKGGYDVVIQPRISRFLLLDDLLFIWTGASESWCCRYEYASAYSWKAAVWMRLIDLFYTRKISIDKIPSELARNWAILKALNRNASVNPDASIDWNVLPAVPDELPEKYFVVLPGAGQPYKIWSVENYASVVQHIVSSTGIRCVVCGSEIESGLGEKIENINSEKVFNLCGKTDILMLTAVIKNSCLVVGNDTGGIHIAALAGVPSVSICGLGSLGRFLPYPEEPEFDYLCYPDVVKLEKDCMGCEWHCKYVATGNRPFPCIAGIHLQQVIRHIERII